MVTKPPARADKRALILDAALSLIKEEGIGSFTQPKVATRSGLRQSHLTYYYPTRNDLLVAVCEEAVMQRLAVLGAVASSTRVPDKISALAGVLIDAEQTRMLLALVQSVDREPTVREAFAELRAGVHDLTVATLVSIGIEPESDVLDLVQSLSTGIAVTTLANGGDAARSRAEAQLRRFFGALRGS